MMSIDQMETLSAFEQGELDYTNYAALFGDEFVEDIMPEEVQSASGMVRVVAQGLGGRRRDVRELPDRLANSAEIVESVLVQEKELTPGEVVLSDALAFESPENRLAVTAIVTTAFTKWEVARFRFGLPALLSGSSLHNRERVLEASEATLNVMRAFQEATPTSRVNNMNLSRIITHRGPRYANEWLSGRLVSSWLAESDLTAKQRELWQPYTSNPKRLASFLVRHTTNTREVFDAKIAQEEPTASMLRLPSRPPKPTPERVTRPLDDLFNGSGQIDKLERIVLVERSNE